MLLLWASTVYKYIAIAFRVVYANQWFNVMLFACLLTCRTREMSKRRRRRKKNPKFRLDFKRKFHFANTFGIWIEWFEILCIIQVTIFTYRLCGQIYNTDRSSKCGALGGDSIATVNAMYCFLSNNRNMPFVTTANVPWAWSSRERLTVCCAWCDFNKIQIKLHHQQKKTNTLWNGAGSLWI